MSTPFPSLTTTSVATESVCVPLAISILVGISCYNCILEKKILVGWGVVAVLLFQVSAAASPFAPGDAIHHIKLDAPADPLRARQRQQLQLLQQQQQQAHPTRLDSLPIRWRPQARRRHEAAEGVEDFSRLLLSSPTNVGLRTVRGRCGWMDG